MNKRGTEKLRCCCSCCLAASIGLVAVLAIAFTRGFSSHRQLSSFYFDSGNGYPVWSDDGKAMAGVVKYWNTGLIFPPSQGWIGSVHPRFEVIIKDGNAPQIKMKATIKHHAISLYFMKNAGYVLANYLRQPNEFRASVLIPLNGDDTRSSLYLSNKGLGFEGGSYTAIPSKDGSTISAVSWKTKEIHSSAYPIDFKVVFIKASSMEAFSMPIAFRAIFTPNKIQGSRQWPFYYWDNNSTFHMTDLQDFSVSLHANGTIEDVGVPTCVPFPTTSGPVRSPDRARLYVDDAGERIEVQEDWDVEDPYCIVTGGDQRSFI